MVRLTILRMILYFLIGALSGISMGIVGVGAGMLTIPLLNCSFLVTFCTEVLSCANRDALLHSNNKIASKLVLFLNTITRIHPVYNEIHNILQY